MKTQSTVYERIAQLVERLANGSQADFARVTNLTAQNIHDAKSGRKGDPSFKTIKNILSGYTSINPEWLIFGTGQMLKGTDQEPTTPLQNARPLSGDVVVVTVDSQNRENIVMVDTKAEAGYPARYVEPEFYRDLPAFSIPLQQFRNATFRAFQVTGDSMNPTFFAGGWVIARYLDYPQEGIQEGYVHVVVTRESVVIKRVLDRVEERDTFALQSDNEVNPTYEVAKENVLQLWRVVADIGFQFPNTRFGTRRRLASLEADFQDVVRRLEKIEVSSEKRPK